MKIGNWEVSDEGINWIGSPKIHTGIIALNTLKEKGPGYRNEMYEWILHFSEKAVATEADIYALNTAFIYAIEKYNLGFDTLSFVKTFTEQQKHIEMNRE